MIRALFNRNFLLKHNQFNINGKTLYNSLSTDSNTKSVTSLASNFTNEEEKYILQQLNEANDEELSKYIPKNRWKKINEWRKRSGHVNMLVDLLEIDGLSVRTLNTICKNILHANSVNEKPIKIRGQLLAPPIHAEQVSSLKSASGVYLHTTGISWARIEKCNNFLIDWNQYDFNLGTKKLSITDALHLVLEVLNLIPSSDVYVFEAPLALTPTTQQSPVSVTVYTQRIQLLSMLNALLNTSQKHNPNFIEQSCIEHSKVFFLRHRLSARLFQTLVGTERISAANTVSNILNNNNSNENVYTVLNVNDQLRSMYEKQDAVSKEILGQALLLTMAFMDLCIYQNVKSLKAISLNSKS